VAGQALVEVGGRIDGEEFVLGRPRGRGEGRGPDREVEVLGHLADDGVSVRKRTIRTSP
jgi:hypothetical protein